MLPLVIRRHWRDPLEGLTRDVDRMVRGYFAESETPAALAPYAVDLREDADHYYVDADLPGFNKNEIDITLENGILTLHAERKQETPEQTAKKGQPLHVERRWTRFERTFTLPNAVKEDAVRAELADGVLTVTLDKREEIKPRKIQVTARDASPANAQPGNGKSGA